MARVSCYHLYLPSSGVGQLPEWCREKGDGVRDHRLKEFEGTYLSNYTSPGFAGRTGFQIVAPRDVEMLWSCLSPVVTGNNKSPHRVGTSEKEN